MGRPRHLSDLDSEVGPPFPNGEHATRFPTNIHASFMYQYQGYVVNPKGLLMWKGPCKTGDPSGTPDSLVRIPLDNESVECLSLS